MTPDQYKASKDELYVGGPFVDYSSRGYKLELAGQETIGSMNAYKIIVTSPDSVVIQYFFDPETGYLVQAVVSSNMGGQQMDITAGYSDYRKTDAGIALPYKIETNYGGQFFLTETVNRLDINQSVDPAIFVKP